MVSLIIPCYNAEKYIGRCLDSVLNQTDRNIELIVVNDGSTDKTARIIEDYRHVLESDITRFIYISQENEGVGAACNNALKKVTGEFLTLLDADDIMLPESIEIRRKWLEEHSTYGLVRTNGYYVTEDNLELCNRLLEVNEYMKNKENVFNELFNGTTYLWPGTYMIRMNVLDKLYPDREIYPSRNGQNMQLVMMAAYVSKAGFIDIPLMKYVLQKESLSHFSSGNVMQKELNAMEGYKDIRKHLVKQFMNEDDQDKWNDKIDKLYANIYLDIALKHKDKDFAKSCYENIKHKGNIEINQQINYYKLMNPVVYWCLRIIRKLGWRPKSFLGRFGGGPKRAADSLLRHNLISVIASDAHSPLQRTPYMLDAYEELSREYSENHLDVLFQYNPARLCDNREILRLEPVPYSGR